MTRSCAAKEGPDIGTKPYLRPPQRLRPRCAGSRPLSTGAQGRTSRISRSVPLGRSGTPDDAELVAFRGGHHLEPGVRRVRDLDVDRTEQRRSECLQPGHGLRAVLGEQVEMKAVLA